MMKGIQFKKIMNAQLIVGAFLAMGMMDTAMALQGTGKYQAIIAAVMGNSNNDNNLTGASSHLSENKYKMITTTFPGAGRPQGVYQEVINSGGGILPFVATYASDNTFISEDIFAAGAATGVGTTSTHGTQQCNAKGACTTQFTELLCEPTGGGVASCVWEIGSGTSTCLDAQCNSFSGTLNIYYYAINPTTGFPGALVIAPPGNPFRVEAKRIPAI